MKKSELKKIIKNELLKEGFEGFNGVIGLGSTNKMTSLDEISGDAEFASSAGEHYVDGAPDVSDQDIAIVIEDALDKIEDMGMGIGENAREVSEMFNRAIAARS